MKKAVCCAALAVALTVTGPELMRALETHVEAALDSLKKTQVGQADAYTGQFATSGASDMLDATLYFRFGQTDVLGAERTQLDIRRDETVARLIVEQLIDGPQTSNNKLQSVFPQGTELFSVGSEGSTVFVTLGRTFLGRPDGAPAGWEDISAWQEEAALRRRLALQSIVLALTEGGRYQRVQFYVADSDDDLPQRIEMVWLDTSVTDLNLVLAPCARDEGVLLTPNRAMGMILDAWQRRDWATLYAMLGAGEGAQLPSYSVFEADMAGIDATLLTYALSAGAVDVSGKRATLVLDAQIRSRTGGDAQIIRESVPLTRVEDNWTISPQTLRSLMVRE